MSLSASKVGLLAHCRYWARPDAPQDPYTTSDAADRGTRFHAAIAAFALTGQLVEWDEDITAEMTQAIPWLQEQSRLWSGGPMLIEQAFGWDPRLDMACQYEVVTDRAYPADGLLHGTADVVFRTGREAFVADWKTGDGSSAGPQMRALALMVARTFGCTTVHVAALEVTAAGVREVCCEELGEFELAAIAGDLAEQMAAIADAEPRPGPHCSELYCPARLACPAATAATAELVDVIPAESLVRRAPYRLTDPIETPEHAAWALDVLRLVSAQVDAIKDGIKARVPAEGWRLEDGRVLRETRSVTSYVDRDRAISLARQLGATDQQLDDCVRSYERSNGLRVVGGDSKPRRRGGKKSAA